MNQTRLEELRLSNYEQPKVTIVFLESKEIDMLTTSPLQEPLTDTDYFPESWLE